MNKRKYTFMRELISRLTLVLLFALMCVVHASAEYAKDTLKIDNFSIKPGETKQVPVYLSNTDNITSLQMDFTLPAGLTCSTSYTINESRLDREEQTVLVKEGTGGLYRLTILAKSEDSSPIAGNSGALVYLSITASKSFNTKGYITLTTIHGSDAIGTDLPIADFKTEVTPQVAKVVTSGNFSIRPDSTLTNIDVLLNNDVNIYGLQVDVTLPAGLSIETKTNGKLKFTYADRLPDDGTVSPTDLGNRKYRLILSALSHKAFIGNSGKLFSFNVKADKSLAEKASILFDNVIVSDTNDVAYELGSSDTVKVTNTYLAQYVPVMEKVDSLFTLYNQANDTIIKNDTNVKDSAAIVKVGADIKAKIETMKKAVETSYGKLTLATDSTSILVPSADIKATIAKWLVDASAAQKAFDVATLKKAANDTAYKKLNTEIAAAQKTFDAVKATIAADDKDVAANFASTEAAIQTKIDSLTASVKKQATAVILTAESTVDTAFVNKAVAQLLVDATTVQKAFVADQAKKAANEAANTKLNSEIAAAQKTFDAAKAAIAADDKDVAASFATTETAIQTKIDSLTTTVKKQFDAVALTAESTIDTSFVNKAVAQLLVDATTAQKAFVADQAKKAANEAANTRLNAEIVTVQAKLDVTKSTIATMCKDVALNFVTVEAAIQHQIDSLTAAVKKQFDAVTLTAESTIDTAVVNKAVSKLLVNAAVAQKAYEAEQAKKAANEAANTKFRAMIAEVQTKFEVTKLTISSICKNVVAKFTATERTIQKQIDSLSTVVETQYENVNLTAESTIDTVSVRKVIDKLLVDAVAAQKEYEKTVGIFDVINSESDDVKIYTTSGQEIPEPIKGRINIFKYANGTIKKILVK